MQSITLIRTDDDSHGTVKHRIVYWYSLAAAPILDANGGKIVVRKSSEIPPEAAPYVNAVDRALLDAGDADFELLFRDQTRGETLAALSTRLLAEHAARGADYIAARRRQFGNAGRGAS